MIEEKKNPPGPEPAEVRRKMTEDAVGYCAELSRNFGDVVRVSTPEGASSYFLFHPDHARQILQDNFRNYMKSRFWERVQKVWGGGLLTAQGESWLRHRRLLQPFFQPQVLKEYAAPMVESIASSLSRWPGFAREGKKVEMTSQMLELSLSVILKVMLGLDLPQCDPRISWSLWKAWEQMNRLYFDPKYSPDDPAIPENAPYKEALSFIEEFVRETIRKQKADPKADTLLFKFLEARYEDTRQPMTEKELRDEIVTLLMAGHETTGNALAWAFYLLSRNPEVEARLQKEAREVLGDREPTADDLSRLPYALEVFQEALRLYPPVWMLERMSLEEDGFSGYDIPGNSIVGFPQYVIHRDSRFWDSPEAFCPERFSQEESAGRPRYAYFPFGGGAHQCIGNNFALMEGQLALAMVARKYRLKMVPGHPVSLLPLMTLVPRNGLLMTLEPL